MYISLNGFTANKVKFNGSEVSKVLFNGTEVWSSEKIITAVGYPINLLKSLGKPLKQYKIYGNGNGIGDKTKNLLNASSGYVGCNNDISSERVFDYANNTFTVKGKVGGGENVASAGQLFFPYSSASTLGTRVESGKTYTLSFEIRLDEQGVYSAKCQYFLLYSNNVRLFGSNFHNTNSSFKKFNCTFTPDRDDRIYLVIRLNNNKFTVKNLQIEEGSTATDYEPYGYKIPVVCSATGSVSVATNIYLNEPLCKKGDYADYIDFKNQKLVKYSQSGESTEETVTLPQLPTIEGNCMISSDTTVQPSNMEIQYVSE